MNILREWVESVMGDTSSENPPTSVHRRILLPGRKGFRVEGIVRIDPVQRVDGPGGMPQIMSTIGWISSQSFSENFEKTRKLTTALGGLISLTLDRRIEIPNEIPISMEDNPQRLTFLPTDFAFDRSIFEDVIPCDLDGRLRETLLCLFALTDRQQEAIISAIELHYAACQLLAFDLRSAYTLLVAGIETLSQTFGNPPTDWSDWHEATSWERFIKVQNLSESQAAALRAKLVKKGSHLRLQETFSSYASTRVPDTFWDEEWDEHAYQYDMPRGCLTDTYEVIDHIKISNIVPHDRGALKSALRQSYNARSGYVHAGKHSIDLYAALAFPRGDDFPNKPLPFLVLRGILCLLIQTELDVEPIDPKEIDFRYVFGPGG